MIRLSWLIKRLPLCYCATNTQYRLLSLKFTISFLFSPYLNILLVKNAITNRMFLNIKVGQVYCSNISDYLYMKRIFVTTFVN